MNERRTPTIISFDDSFSQSYLTLNDLARDRVHRLDVGVARPDAVHHRQAEAAISGEEEGR